MSSGSVLYVIEQWLFLWRLILLFTFCLNVLAQNVTFSRIRKMVCSKTVASDVRSFFCLLQGYICIKCEIRECEQLLRMYGYGYVRLRQRRRERRPPQTI